MSRAGTGPRVSVVMTVLNPHPTYFPEAVQSVLGQTMANFELLIVEDPSPQPAAPLLARFEDPRIRHLANPARTSLIQQRNQGLAAARCPLVALLDADDIAEPDRLDKQLRYLAAHPEVDVLGSQIRIIDRDGRCLGYRPFPLGHDQIVRAMRRVVPLSQPSVLFRKAAVEAAGGYRAYGYTTAEDYELWSRLVQRGARFANHPEPLLRYRVHPGQMKSTHLRETIRGILKVKQMYWWEQMDFGSRLRARVERLMLFFPPWLVLRLFMRNQYRLWPTGASPVGHLPASAPDLPPLPGEADRRAVVVSPSS